MDGFVSCLLFWCDFWFYFFVMVVVVVVVWKGCNCGGVFYVCVEKAVENLVVRKVWKM